MSVGDIELVDWDDHTGPWAEDIGVALRERCTVGKVVREDDEVLILAASWDLEGDYDLACIGKAMVKARLTL